MHARLITLFIGIAALISGTVGRAEAPHSRQTPSKAANPTAQTEEAALRQLAQEMAAAIKARDADRLMKSYQKSDDLIVYDLGPEFEYRGWEAYRKNWQDAFTAFKSVDKMEITDLRVKVSGSMGYFSGRWRMEATPLDGDRFLIEGRLTDVAQKMEGKWLIVHEHTSVPVPLDFAVKAVPPPAILQEVQYLAANIKGDGASGIEGIASISPIHGGPTRVGEIDSKPLPNALITVQREEGSLPLAQQKTDARGRFRMALKPGTYRMVPLPPNPGAVLPRGAMQTVTVRAGQFTRLTAEYDSGLR